MIGTELSIADAVDMAKSFAHIEARRFGLLSRTVYETAYDERMTALIHREVAASHPEWRGKL